MAEPLQDLLIRVREAVIYSYEAGEFQPGIDPVIQDYLEGDGGLLKTLSIAITLFEDLQRVEDLLNADYKRPVKCVECNITFSSHPDYLNHLAAIERHEKLQALSDTMTLGEEL